jgi:hypothetical protein
MCQLCRISQEKTALAISGHIAEGSGTPVPACCLVPAGLITGIVGLLLNA